MSTLKVRTVTLIAVVLHVVLVGTSSAFAQAGPPQGINVNITNPLPVPVTLQGFNPTTEIIVRSADNPALSAVTIQFRAQANNTTGGQPGSLLTTQSYTVPAGQRLVIEYVDSRFLVSNVPAGSMQINFDVTDSVPNTPTIFHTIGFSSESMRCTLSQICGGIAKTVKIYVDEGHTVRAEGTILTAVAGVDAIFVGTLNGHLVAK